MTKRLLIALSAGAAVCALAAPAASASTSQVSIIQDNSAINANPMGALTKMKAMGFTMVKYVVYWNQYAPTPTSTKVPTGATTPSTYARYLTSLEAIDEDATKVGIKLGFMVTSPAPRWAEGSGCTSLQESEGICKPSDAYFQDFVSALGTTFNGSTGFPAVRWWSVWNEPNYIPNLAPQLSGSTYEGPDQYRGLLNAGWKGLNGTGHTTSSDTILFGETAPRGISGGNKGYGPSQDASGYKPVAFIADLYCETTSGKRFTGKLASENGCGSSGSAFKSANPALFDASGFANHPYSQGLEPDQKSGDCVVKFENKPQNLFCLASKVHPADPLWTDLADISNLEGGLATDLKAYGSTKKFPIWSTEYGFWTSPPGNQACRSVTSSYCDLSQTNAAYYLNWSEYISYKNSRIASIDQYQLYDPTSGEWTDGLLSHNGKTKPAYAAYELPLFMPTTTATKAGNLTVWGGARPAAYDAATISGSQPTVAIQFEGKTGGWKTVKTVTINLKSAGGYFSLPVKFTTSGSVRLTYKVGATSLTSRTQKITIG